MLLQCRPLFMGEEKSLPIDTELDFSQVEYQGTNPLANPVRVTGAVTVRAGVVQLSARAAFTFHGRCDRCLTPFDEAYDIPLENTLVATLENEENDDYILLDQYRLDLDDLVMADILLELPYKSLCREDCRGLCPMCGKNLNEGLCGCNRKSVDPRLAVLGQLLE
ncbi:MAG: DUF177 domain-containing protein [Clostridia bacterium]|nr:DUF177 domain-containing protein [Clostridia bacterium]